MGGGKIGVMKRELPLKTPGVPGFRAFPLFLVQYDAVSLHWRIFR